MADYVDQQSVREEAGLQNEVTAESLTGVADGNNRVFVVRYRPIVDRNYDGLVSPADVVAYVNGAPVTIASVSPATGAITLQNAPASNAVITADYASSAVKDAYVEEAIANAMDLINEQLMDVVTLPYPDNAVPATVRYMTRVLAAGILLTRDYGFNTNLQDSSKDGYKKIDFVLGTDSKEGMLSRYWKRIEASQSGGEDVVAMESDGHVMSRLNSQGQNRPIRQARHGGENFIFTDPDPDLGPDEAVDRTW